MPKRVLKQLTVDVGALFEEGIPYFSIMRAKQVSQSFISKVKKEL